MVNSCKSMFLSLALGACFAVFLSGCSRPEPSFECADILGCVEVGPGEPVKIGVLQALSGKVTPLGQAQIRGLELALDKRDNQILGHPVVLQIEDTGCTAEGGANAALKIIADLGSVAIFGTTCSGAAATAAKAMSDAGLTMVSGNNSAPFLTSIAGHAAPSWQAGYFRTAPNEENAGKAAAQYVYQQLGLRRAATVNDNDLYTKGLTESFSKAFVELGGTVVLDTAISKGDTQMLPLLTAVARSGAELLFFPLFQPEGNHLLLQARELPAFDKILLISGGALIESSFLEAVGDAARGMCFVGPARPAGPAVEQLTAAYRAKYNDEPTAHYYLSGYDAAAILFHSIEQVAVRDTDGTLHIGRKKLRETLYAIRMFRGVSGSLSCDQFGDCGTPSFRVLRMDEPTKGLLGLEDNVLFTGSSDNE